LSGGHAKIAEQFKKDWNEGRILKLFQFLKDLENNAENIFSLPLFFIFKSGCHGLDMTLSV